VGVVDRELAADGIGVEAGDLNELEAALRRAEVREDSTKGGRRSCQYLFSLYISPELARDQGRWGQDQLRTELPMRDNLDRIFKRRHVLLHHQARFLILMRTRRVILPTVILKGKRVAK
jgi:hypothetical protein